MQNIKIFSNKILEDIASQAKKSPCRPTELVHDWRAYVQHHRVAAETQKSPNDQRQDTCKTAPDIDTKPSRWRHLNVDAHRGARAGYLVGCALTSSTDWFFGTPAHATDIDGCVKEVIAYTAPRTFYGVLRTKPTLERVYTEDGLLGRAYAVAAALLQWMGANSGALIGAVGFALVRGVQFGTRWLCGKDDLEKLEMRQPERTSFATQLRSVALRGDKIGAVVAGFPLYLALGVLIGGAMLTSATVKATTSAAGALIGAVVGAHRDVLSYRGNIVNDGKELYAAGRVIAKRAWIQIIDTFDDKAPLYRAMMAAAQRDIDPDDLIEELTLVHPTID